MKARALTKRCLLKFGDAILPPGLRSASYRSAQAFLARRTSSAPAFGS